MRSGENFFNLYNHDFIRAAVGIPAVRVADPEFNTQQTIELIREAAGRDAALVLFPELGLSAYSCDDLFHQRAMLEACRDGVATILEASLILSPVAVVGCPLVFGHLLYN